MRYFAHRGESCIHRDNSIESIQAAINGNYAGVEIDVQLSRDNILVLYHDIYIKDRFVNKLYYRELAELNVISLDKLYNTIDLSETNILLDIKGTDINIVNMLNEFYLKHDYHRVIFCSFNRNIARNIPKCFRRGIIFETVYSENEYEALTSGFDVVVMHWTCLCSSFLNHCIRNEIKTFTYTHKEPMELKYMKKFNVDFIITNGFPNV